MSLGYRIVERFDPTWQAAWTKYVEWSKLAHLTEVVGLDCCLCPAVVKANSAEDWEHVLYPEHLCEVFDDWQYAISRLPSDRDLRSLQVLAVLREPTQEQMLELPPAGFKLIGFDLIEERTCISALNNCGGFADVFRPEHLNERGLVSDLSSARDVRLRLREAHPEEPHADCAVWAVWRRTSA
jgi:hypothetical protein